jgi:hypothetical protein
MPILWALADPKIGEREVLAAMLDVEPGLAAARPGLILITDKGFADRQLIESVNDTLKGQLDLEAHGGRTFEGVAIRVAQRVLAMAAAIWHNNKTGRPVTRSLIAYDH